MKLITIHFLLIIALFSLSNCKKDDDDDTQNNTGITVDATGNVSVPNDANGACYASKTLYYDNNTGTSYTDYQLAYAWFGTVNAYKNGGIVEFNNQELSSFNNIYIDQGFGNSFFPSDSVEWEVSGNTSNGIPAFNYTDIQEFPSNGGEFELPAIININNPLTINFSPINNVYAVVYTLAGNKGQNSKAVQNGASSVSFTAAEINAVAFADDILAVSITSVVYQTQTFSGKKIYFVKQFQHLRQTYTE